MGATYSAITTPSATALTAAASPDPKTKACEKAANLRTETSEYETMLPPTEAATTAAAAGSALVTSAPTTATDEPLLLILTCPGWNPDADPEALANDVVCNAVTKEAKNSSETFVPTTVAPSIP